MTFLYGGIRKYLQTEDAIESYIDNILLYDISHYQLNNCPFIYFSNVRNHLFIWNIFSGITIMHRRLYKAKIIICYSSICEISRQLIGHCMGKFSQVFENKTLYDKGPCDLYDWRRITRIDERRYEIVNLF